MRPFGIRAGLRSKNYSLLNYSKEPFSNKEEEKKDDAYVTAFLQGTCYEGGEEEAYIMIADDNMYTQRSKSQALNNYDASHECEVFRNPFRG